MKEQKRGNRRTVNFYLLGLEQWLETFQKNSLILIFMELNQLIKSNYFLIGIICIYWLNQLGPKYGDSFTLTQQPKNALKNLLETIHQFHLLSLGIRLVYGAGYWHKV